MKMTPQLMQRNILSVFVVTCRDRSFVKIICRSDTQSNYSQISGASSNWEDTDYDDRGDRASNATEAHQRQQWQQQQQPQQLHTTHQPKDAGRAPKKVTYAQQLVQSLFPQVLPSSALSSLTQIAFQGVPAAQLVSEDSGAGVGGASATVPPHARQ